jgi:transposase
MDTPMSVSMERYLGIDLHKHYLVVGGVNAQQAIVLPPRRLALDDWPKWTQTHLTQADVVVVEATTNAWDFYDMTSPLVKRVVVANAAKIALIAKTRVKTDQKDVMVLARLLAAGLIPEVWVPPVEVRELRSLVSHRQQVVRTRTALKNRLQSVLHRHTCTCAASAGVTSSCPVATRSRIFIVLGGTRCPCHRPSVCI